MPLPTDKAGSLVTQRMTAAQSKARRIRIPNRSTHLALAARQLATLFQSGVPITRCLEILQQQAELPQLREVFAQVSKSVSSGQTLSRAFAQFPDVFPRIFVSLVQIGESTGRLGECLEQLTSLLERDGLIVRRVKSSLSYPIFILSVTALLTLAIFYFVLPTFASVFASMNIPLPLVTTLMIWLTQALRTPWVWVVSVGVLVGGYRLLGLVWADRVGRLRLFRLLTSVPMIGHILVLAAVARYCWVLEGTLNSGMDLPKSLRLAATASDSPLLMDDSEKAVATISDGGTLSRHLKQHTHIYPRVMTHMVQTGEETSSMAGSFKQLARWFDEELNFRLDLLNAALEPLLMMVMAVIVGSIVLAIFLPMYGYIGKLSS